MELPFWNHVPRAVTGLLLTSVSPATLMKAFWAPKSYPTPKELLSAAKCVLSRRAGYNVMRMHGVSFAHGRAGCSCLYETKDLQPSETSELIPQGNHAQDGPPPNYDFNEQDKQLGTAGG